MPTEILMPALSPTMEEGTLAKWHVHEGDEVRTGDVIVGSKERVIVGIPQLQVLLSNERGKISLNLIRDGQPTVVHLMNQ